MLGKVAKEQKLWKQKTKKVAFRAGRYRVIGRRRRWRRRRALHGEPASKAFVPRRSQSERNAPCSRQILSTRESRFRQTMSTAPHRLLWQLSSVSYSLGALRQSGLAFASK